MIKYKSENELKAFMILVLILSIMVAAVSYFSFHTGKEIGIEIGKNIKQKNNEK